MGCSKCEYYFRLTFFPTICLINTAASALNFISGYWIPGIGLGSAAVMLVLFITIVVRLGWKSVGVQIQEEVERQRIGVIAVDGNAATVTSYDAAAGKGAAGKNINNNGGSPYSSRGNSMSTRGAATAMMNGTTPLLTPEMLEVEAEHKILTTRTIFRRTPMPFIIFAAIVLVPALGAMGYFLYYAIDSHERFNILVLGNKWIPFVAYLALAGPCIDIIKVLLKSRKEVREYMLNGGEIV